MGDGKILDGAVDEDIPLLTGEESPIFGDETEASEGVEP